jgi:isoamylase
MTQNDWDSAQASALTVFLNGNAISEPGARGERITDDSFLLMFNPSPEPLEFVVPVNHGRQWQVVVDTARTEVAPPDADAKIQAGDRLTLPDRSMTVLRRPAQ